MQTEDCIVNIDGYCWTVALRGLAQKDRNAIVTQYVAEMTRIVQEHRGQAWNVIGDCIIASAFPCADKAISAVLDIQSTMLRLNESWLDAAGLKCPLVIRIGVALGSAPDVPPKKRGETSSAALCVAGHLQKHCPPGRILIAKDVFERLTVYSNDFRPGPFLKADALGTYVSSARAMVPSEIIARRRLTPKQGRCFPLMPFTSPSMLLDGTAPDLCHVADVLDDALIVLGETNRWDLTFDKSAVHVGAATSDAAGAIELLATRSCPTLACGLDEWVETEDQAFRRNLMLLGSPVVNIYAYALDSILSPQAVRPGPAGFWFDESGLMRIKIIDARGHPLAFPMHVDHAGKPVDQGGKSRHYGLALICRSPFNPDRSLVWVAGITGMATYAVARFLHDMISDPKGTLYSKRTDDCPMEEQPNVAIVTPTPGEKWDIQDYVSGGWRVSEYRICWLGRLYGKALEEPAHSKRRTARHAVHHT